MLNTASYLVYNAYWSLQWKITVCQNSPGCWTLRVSFTARLSLFKGGGGRVGGEKSGWFYVHNLDQKHHNQLKLRHTFHRTDFVKPFHLARYHCDVLFASLFAWERSLSRKFARCFVLPDLKKKETKTTFFLIFCVFSTQTEYNHHTATKCILQQLTHFSRQGVLCSERLWTRPSPVYFAAADSLWQTGCAL